MRVEISKGEAVTIICDGKVIAEHVADHDALSAAYHSNEIAAARVASVLLPLLRRVGDWQAFADGAKDVRRKHPTADVPDYIGPPEDESGVTPDRVKQYREAWCAGEFVRKFLTEDQMALFSDEEGEQRRAG